MWRVQWEAKRLPLKRWFEIQDFRFSNENKRNRELLVSESTQQLIRKTTSPNRYADEIDGVS